MSSDIINNFEDFIKKVKEFVVNSMQLYACDDWNNTYFTYNENKLNFHLCCIIVDYYNVMEEQNKAQREYVNYI